MEDHWELKRSPLEPAGSGASTDDQLIQLILAGKVRGLGRLYDRHGSNCLKAASGILATRADAEDLVFEVFLMMWRDPPPPGTSVRQFLVSRILEKSQELPS